MVTERKFRQYYHQGQMVILTKILYPTVTYVINLSMEELFGLLAFAVRL